MPNTFRVATFSVDATPPLNFPIHEGSAKRIVERQSARGIVLLGAGDPIVLATVDWVGISGDARDEWHAILADAADTTPDRISLHVVHQHEAPRASFAPASELLTRFGIRYSSTEDEKGQIEWFHSIMAESGKAVKEAIKHSVEITDIGTANVRVDRVASQRRILGSDGKVSLIRLSNPRQPTHTHARMQRQGALYGYRISPDYEEEARNQPEGLIDPNLKTLYFFGGQAVVAVLSFYATHPQFTTGTGMITSDFVGVVRRKREAETGTFHLHFTGAAGNITVGKYNDGSDAALNSITECFYDAMKEAWDNKNRRRIDIHDIEWRSTLIFAPLKSGDALDLHRVIAENPNQSAEARLDAAQQLHEIERLGRGISAKSLRLSDNYVLFMPQELFVEYQIMAQEVRPQNFVAMAAYGENAGGYVGTDEAYIQGGYETAAASRLGYGVEAPFKKAIMTLLE